MFELFNQKTHGSSSLHVSPRHEYVSERFDEAYVRLAHYFRKSVRTVESDNLLCQVIHHANVVYTGNDEQYYYAVASRVEKIATALRLNTAVHKSGPLVKNHFYGSDVTEYVLAVTRGYPTGLDAGKYWMSFQPLQAVSHPYSDLNMNPRNGAETTGVRGVAVLTLDVPLLMLQYTRWRLYCEKYLDQQPDVTQFVFQYPVVNLIPSDTDVCYFNQLKNLVQGQPNVPQKRRYGLGLNDVTVFVEKEQKEFMEEAIKKNASIMDLALGTPMVFSETLWDFLQLPPGVYTNKNSGLWLLGYLPYLAYLAQLSKQAKSNDNTAAAAYLQKKFRYFKNAGFLTSYPGLETEIDEEVINYLT
jgi:hypothetical protein